MLAPTAHSLYVCTVQFVLMYELSSELIIICIKDIIIIITYYLYNLLNMLFIIN